MRSDGHQRQSNATTRAPARVDGDPSRRVPHPSQPRNVTQALSQGNANGIDLRKLAMRQTLPVALAFGLVVLMWDKIAQLDIGYIHASLKTVGALQWAGAAVFSALSFWALGRYDRVVHRLIGSPIASGDAQRAGVTAIALSQTVGMGVISSAFVRWRMLPEISFLQAMRISVIVSISFLSGLAVVASLVALTVPMTLPWAGWLAWIVLATACAFAVLTVFRPRPFSGIHLPPLRAMGAFLGLAFLDTAAAGAALWMVLPEGCDIGIVPLVAAYLIALGAGLVSGTPGGMGAFEITLLALLPELGQEPLLAAVLAFRAVYYAVPAILAALVTIRGPRRARACAPAEATASLHPVAQAPHLPAQVAEVLREAPRAEAGLLRQGRLSLIETAQGQPAAIGAASGQSLIMLSDPLIASDSHLAFFKELHGLARRSYLSPFLYKIGARTASSARALGWNVLPIAKEAWLNPQTFTLDGAAKRQLRRKLRAASKAGIAITEAGADLPLSDMERIARNWSEARGGERGFSMGVWHPESLPHSRVFLAHHQGRLVGFITLHSNQNEQVLDLMRPAHHAPDGTMHALLTQAIECAAQMNCPRLSLAAVPLGPHPEEPLLFRHARQALDRSCRADGLRQFKSAFAPSWETLYAAAPSRLSLGLGAVDVAREICRKIERPTSFRWPWQGKRAPTPLNRRSSPQ